MHVGRCAMQGSTLKSVPAKLLRVSRLLGGGLLLPLTDGVVCGSGTGFCLDFVYDTKVSPGALDIFSQPRLAFY